MISFLYFKDFFKLPDLCKPYRRMKFRYPVIVSYKWMKICAAVHSLMVVSVITVTISLNMNIFFICKHHAAFRTGHCFYKVERKSTGISNSAKKFAFIRRADTLAGILDQQ